MGSKVLLVAGFAVFYVIAISEAAGSCPLPSKIYGCSPKCVQNYECTHGKVCCPNSCNAKSCAEPAGNSDSSGGNKYSQTGSYCDNVKCNSFEKCVMDRQTKRMKCVRA